MQNPLEKGNTQLKYINDFLKEFYKNQKLFKNIVSKYKNEIKG